MSVDLAGPVGLRNRRESVLNFSGDQRGVIDLLSAIRLVDGGRAEAWTTGGDPWLGRPSPGPDGSCPAALADAIWSFQDHWRARGVFRVIDGVVDPGGRTLAKLNALAEDAKGQARLLVGSDAIIKAYPEFADVVAPSADSILVEMTHFDIGEDELKPAHKDAIFQAVLKATNKDFSFIQAYGFHSRTGGPGYDNLGLAARRAENAIKSARFLGIIDARVRTWRYMPIAWRVGMPPGESPLMRKVLLLFRAVSSFDARRPVSPSKLGQLRTF